MESTSGAGQAHDRGELARTLKPSWVWAIALGSAVGWGAFVLPADWIAAAGPLGAILGFLFGGLLMLVIAVSYGLLIRVHPVSGGEFAYAYVGFGRRHAFVCGWFLTLGYTCIVALNASALALLARYVPPRIAEVGLLYEVAGWKIYLGEVLIASVALIVFAALNALGAGVSGRLQFILVLVMLAGVAAIVTSVLLHPDSHMSNLQPLFPDDVAPVAAVLTIVALAPWAYVGFDNVPQAAEEFNFAPRKAFRLITLAILAAAALYALMILATAAAVPWTTLVAGEPAWGTADAMAQLFGGIGILLLALSVSVGICTGLNGFYVAASRLLFAMARARMIPALFGKLLARRRTPIAGIAGVCALCLIVPWFGRQALLWVVDMSAVGVTIAYTYTCLTAFKLFRKSGTSMRGQVLSLLGAVTGATFLGLLLIPASPAALGLESAIALLIWIVLGLVFYLVRRKEYTKLNEQELDYLILGNAEPADGTDAHLVPRDDPQSGSG